MFAAGRCRGEKDHHREQHLDAINNSIETLKLLMRQFLTYKSGQVHWAISGPHAVSRGTSSNSPTDIRVAPQIGHAKRLSCAFSTSTGYRNFLLNYLSQSDACVMRICRNIGRDIAFLIRR